MSTPSTVNRRRFLRTAIGVSAGLIAAPALPAEQAAAQAITPTAPDGMLPFVEHYASNVGADLTPGTNAAVDILSGMARLWRTGTAWNNGVVLDRELLRANVRHSIKVTAGRTEEQAKQAFIHDRQDQSYGVIDGLGPLAPLYRTGAKAVTSITSAPDGTPATTVNDAVPADAPAGSAVGAGSTGSDLGRVVTLVQTLRGPYSSGNPAKLAFGYPRPWRMTEDGEVVDTGAIDAFGYPVYRSEVRVAPQLLRQRSLTPATDCGFPSGHTNAFFLAALALAYAVPERFQELVTRAFELSDSRITAGMHSAVDAIGGRVLATALAAAILNDPANAAVKAAARRQALAYFQAHTGTTADTLYAYAQAAPASADPYADRETNADAVTPLLTYGLPHRSGGSAMVVPKGAEVLLETRLPYLDAGQRREVLRTTALPPGHPLLDGPELWGRLNLFAAADGYGRFDADVLVTMDAAAGGFQAADTWRNDIDGPCGLAKLGTGTLTLTGTNRFTGGTRVLAGTLAAGARDALGRGDVTVEGGTLKIAADGPVRVQGCYVHSAGALELSLGRRDEPALRVGGAARLAPDSTLTIRPSPSGAPCREESLRVISAHGLQGRFAAITVDAPGLRVEPHYTATGLSVRLIADGRPDRTARTARTAGNDREFTTTAWSSV